MTYPPLDEQMCGNCRYRWEHLNECRRHAPHPSHKELRDAWWPGVGADDWCGEWSPKE